MCIRDSHRGDHRCLVITPATSHFGKLPATEARPLLPSYHPTSSLPPRCTPLPSYHPISICSSSLPPRCRPPPPPYPNP
eukprot:scaffold103061_cov18-Phaeocystis_antarctica.AAC.1